MPAHPKSIHYRTGAEAMTTAEKKNLRKTLRTLRSQRRDWLCGRGLPWGLPWCTGNGPHHQRSFCEGCATRLHYRDRAEEIACEIQHLEMLAR
jgi:hypothetical protein